MKNIAIAKVGRTNPLIDDDSEQRKMEHLPSEYVYRVGTTSQRLFYKNPDGRALTDREMMMVVGQRTFNLDDPIDEHNWKTLKAMLLIPDLASLKESLVLIEPQADAKRKLTQDRLQFQLEEKLWSKEDDNEFLAKLYRRVVGLSDGITASVMLTTLLDLAREDVKKFLANGKWIFEDDNWETRALLDLCIERKVLKRDGEFIKNTDDSILAENFEKAIFKIQNDHQLRSTLSARISEVKKSGPDTTIQLEDPELLKALMGISEEVEQTPTNPDGTMDENAVKNKERKRISDLIAKIEAAELVKKDGETGPWTLTMEDHQVTGREGLFDYFTKNEEAVKNYETLVGA